MLNLYCDESCHLLHQTSGMVLGSVVVPSTTVAKHAQNIRGIKATYGMPVARELKWTRVSPSKVDVYKAVIDYFFQCPDLSFRGVLIRDKSILQHEAFHQTPDDWYYKMYYVLLKRFLAKEDSYRIYIDIKDTRGYKRMEELRTVLRNSSRDFNGDKVVSVQEIRSHEVQIMSVVDLIIGAISYTSRGEVGSSAKLALCEHIKKRAGFDIVSTTSMEASKFNLLNWRPAC